MDESVGVRRARAEDYDCIVALVDEWWGRPVGSCLPRLFQDHFWSTSRIVEDRLGLAAFLIAFLSPSRPRLAYVHFVGVRPDHRGSGLARELYEGLARHAQEQGCTELRAITAPGNTGSIRFHKGLGFTVSGPVADYNGPGRPYGDAQPPTQLNPANDRHTHRSWGGGDAVFECLARQFRDRLALSGGDLGSAVSYGWRDAEGDLRRSGCLTRQGWSAGGAAELVDDLVSNLIGEPGAVLQSDIVLLEVDVAADGGVVGDVGGVGLDIGATSSQVGRHDVDDEQDSFSGRTGDLDGDDLQLAASFIHADVAPSGCLGWSAYRSRSHGPRRSAQSCDRRGAPRSLGERISTCPIRQTEPLPSTTTAAASPSRGWPSRSTIVYRSGSRVVGMGLPANTHPAGVRARSSGVATDLARAPRSATAANAGRTDPHCARRPRRAPARRPRPRRQQRSRPPGGPAPPPTRSPSRRPRSSLPVSATVPGHRPPPVDRALHPPGRCAGSGRPPTPGRLRSPAPAAPRWKRYG